MNPVQAQSAPIENAIEEKRPGWLLPTPARTDEPAADQIKRYLLQLMRGEDLSRVQAAALLSALLDGACSDAQIAAALVALAIKGESVEELAGMAEAMRSHSVRIKSPHAVMLDTAGTGSSSAKTFNVSTAAAFVIAAAGLPVAKHGSRAATSRSGSADVLTALGVRVDVPAAVSERCLAELGICFMFAPLYHPATARVAQVRRQLGVHTTFNLLGPLTNPAGASRQLLGVWHPELMQRVAGALATLGAERAWVVRGNDGLDEITLAEATTAYEVEDGWVKRREITPRDFGLRETPIAALAGGDPQQNAAIILSVLENRRHDAAGDLVVMNAAAGIYIGGRAESLKDAAELAQSVIASGGAREKLTQFAAATNAREPAK
jgi:anthranilate phosphoribosyltransferase